DVAVHGSGPGRLLDRVQAFELLLSEEVDLGVAETDGLGEASVDDSADGLGGEIEVISDVVDGLARTAGLDDPAVTDRLLNLGSLKFGHESSVARGKCLRDKYLVSETVRSEEHTTELQSRENLVCR